MPNMEAQSPVHVLTPLANSKDHQSECLWGMASAAWDQEDIAEDPFGSNYQSHLR